MGRCFLIFLVRILLPLTISIVVFVRPVGISFVYLTAFFLSPWLLQSRSYRQKFITHLYLLILCILSLVFLSGHGIITLLTYLHVLDNMPHNLILWMRYIGFTSLLNLRITGILHWILPDMLISIVCGSILGFLKFSNRTRKSSITSMKLSDPFYKDSEYQRMLVFVYIQSVLKTTPIFALLVLYLASAFRPSMPGSLYFLMFIIAGTHWAIYRKTHHIQYPLIVMLIALCFHIIALFIYQFPLTQMYLNYESFWARIMGMEALIEWQQMPSTIIIDFNKNLFWDSFANPFALMLAYFVTNLSLILRSHYFLSFEMLQQSIDSRPSSLKSNDSSINNQSSSRRSTEEQTFTEQTLYIIYDISKYIYNRCYILLNIVMMIWSIVFHSWITFVLLIWANILWMIPNQRKSMMRSSFFVMVYAEFLVIAQYIYGMNLNESELPTKLESCGYNLEQIGFIHPQNINKLPFFPLTVKTAFLFVFWISSRLYFKEQIPKSRRSEHLINQIFGEHFYNSRANINVDNPKSPRLIMLIFKSLNLFIGRIWMWMLIYILFFCAIFEHFMNAFRICYMPLFLLFLTTFQISEQIWIFSLFGYWVFLIFYAMSVLIIIYTYQFDGFDAILLKYFNINNALQSDIGLRKYKTSALFLHLARPTIIIILTALHLHYFHYRFINALLLPKTSVESMPVINSFIRSSYKATILEDSKWNKIFVIAYRKCRHRMLKLFRPVKRFIWVMFDLHILKAVQIAAFSCTIKEVCLLNVMMLSLSLISTLNIIWVKRLVIRLMTIWVSVLIIMKMIYQFQYWHHEDFDINCQSGKVNFAIWLGLQKIGLGTGALLRYILTYIIFMVVTSLHSLVKFRENLLKQSLGFYTKNTIPFPHIDRKDAEQGMVQFFQFLCNYGFYKFGFEITLIGLVSSIAYRCDIYSLIHCLWLILLLCLGRRKIINIWWMFQLYYIICIFIQYLYMLNFPPTLCQVLWYGKTHKQQILTIWMLLPESIKSYYQNKIMLEFIILLLIAAQRTNFHVEKIHANDNIYPGGNNRSIINRLTSLGSIYFPNPTHDFCSYVRNYADILKAAIFCSSFGFTVSIVFMAGLFSYDILAVEWFNLFCDIGGSKKRQMYGPSALVFENPLIWHAIVFGFIIFQLRIFQSYYFSHIVVDTQANAVLASRGASIIQHLHYKQIHDRRVHELEVLKSIKLKMERIRAANHFNYGKRNLRLSRSLIAPDLNYDNKSTTRTSGAARPLYSRSGMPRNPNPNLHANAVRMADYYMFEEIDDDTERDTFEEYDFLEREEYRERLYKKANRYEFLDDDGLKEEEEDLRSSRDSNDSFFKTNPVIKLLSKLIIMLTTCLNRLTRNYRFVHRVLSSEKKVLQRMGIMDYTTANVNISPIHEVFLSNPHPNESISRVMSRLKEFTAQEHNIFVDLLIALWYTIVANTEAICYITIFVNQAVNSSLISLPLPILVLGWGALTLPRPSKKFWLTTIVYTLFMIVFQSVVHQFDMKYTQTLAHGLVIKYGHAIADLFLLIVLFWHRYMLKKQGNWNLKHKKISQLKQHFSRITSAFSDPHRRHAESQNTAGNIDDSLKQSVSEFEQELNELFQTQTESQYDYDHIESVHYRSVMKRLHHKRGVCTSIYKFFFALRHKARLSTDVYTLIFLCDFISFLILLFGFPNFADRFKYAEGSIQTYIEQNKVPLLFLLILIIQFSTILIERVIYLRKALISKIIFHYFTIFCIHIWMFFVNPIVTLRNFGEQAAPVIFYLIKCIHMMLSAYQIRCGYSKRMQGNVFCKSYSVVNLILYKIYLEIPFLYILRTMLDWVCIRTTLGIIEWIKMEDIFQSIFIVRCFRQMSADFPVVRGVPKVWCLKLFVGGFVLFILITIIWFPLFLFALLGAVGRPNLPIQAEITLKISQYGPIFKSETYNGISQFNNKEFANLNNLLASKNFVTTRILTYDPSDLTSIKFNRNSVDFWGLTPPDKERLLFDLKSTKKLNMRLFIGMRLHNNNIKYKYDGLAPLTSHARQTLIEALTDGTAEHKPIIIPNILPKILSVHDGIITRQLGARFDRPVKLQRIYRNSTSWWDLTDYCGDKFYKEFLSSLPYSSCDDGIVFYAVNEKSFPKSIDYIAKAGIIGLYTTFVFVASRIVRSCISHYHSRIMFLDLPYVDRLLKLCYDIYLVREAEEWRLEEDLYGKLIFLYRSPETLIKWTRYKYEENISTESRRSTSNPPTDETTSEITTLVSSNTQPSREWPPQPPGEAPPQPRRESPPQPSTETPPEPPSEPSLEQPSELPREPTPEPRTETPPEPPTEPPPPPNN